MGTNCASLFVDVFLHAYDTEYLQGIITCKDRKFAPTFPASPIQMIIYTTSIQMSLHLKILLIFKRLPLTVTFTLVSTTEEDYKRDDFTFQWSTSPSSVAIIQHPQRMDITFHNSYVTLELVSSTVGRVQLLTQFVLKKYTLLLCCGHRYKNFTVVITIWLTVTKYPYLK